MKFQILLNTCIYVIQLLAHWNQNIDELELQKFCKELAILCWCQYRFLKNTTTTNLHSGTQKQESHRERYSHQHSSKYTLLTSRHQHHYRNTCRWHNHSIDSRTNPHIAQQQVQPYLQEIFDWTKQNQLTLNVSKTTTTLFTPDPAEYNTYTTYKQRAKNLRNHTRLDLKLVLYKKPFFIFCFFISIKNFFYEKNVFFICFFFFFFFFL